MEAIIKPFKLDDVKDALNHIEVTGLTISEVKGFGRQKGHKEINPGAEYNSDFVPKIKHCVVADATLAGQAIDTILEKALAVKIGDGKIFVSEIEKVIRIRTGNQTEKLFSQGKGKDS